MKISFSSQEFLNLKFDVDKEKLLNIFKIYLTQSNIESINYLEALGSFSYFI